MPNPPCNDASANLTALLMWNVSSMISFVSIHVLTLSQAFGRMLLMNAALMSAVDFSRIMVLAFGLHFVFILIVWEYS